MTLAGNHSERTTVKDFCLTYICDGDSSKWRVGYTAKATLATIGTFYYVAGSQSLHML